MWPWPWTPEKTKHHVSESESVSESVSEPVSESKLPTIAIAIDTLTKENMMTRAIPMTMKDYKIESKGKLRFPWSQEQKIVDRWNSVYQKINTGEIKDIFLDTYKIHINLDNGDSAIIYMPYGTLTYMDRNTNVIRTEVIPYFMNQITGEIQQSYGA